MSSVSVGDIYKVLISFEDDPSQNKSRPAVIIDIQDSEDSIFIAILSPITGSAPKKPPTYYDAYKVPIEKWQEAGLHKKSYVKSNQIIEVPKNALFKQIGKMNIKDLEKAKKAINNYLQNE